MISHVDETRNRYAGDAAHEAPAIIEMSNHYREQ